MILQLLLLYKLNEADLLLFQDHGPRSFVLEGCGLTSRSCFCLVDHVEHKADLATQADHA